MGHFGDSSEHGREEASGILWLLLCFDVGRIATAALPEERITIHPAQLRQPSSVSRWIPILHWSLGGVFGTFLPPHTVGETNRVWLSFSVIQKGRAEAVLDKLAPREAMETARRLFFDRQYRASRPSRPAQVAGGAARRRIISRWKRPPKRRIAPNGNSWIESVRSRRRRTRSSGRASIRTSGGESTWHRRCDGRSYRLKFSARRQRTLDGIGQGILRGKRRSVWCSQLCCCRRTKAASVGGAGGFSD